MTLLGKILSVVALGAVLSVPALQSAQAQNLGNLRPEVVAGASAALLTILVLTLDESDSTTQSPPQQ